MKTKVALDPWMVFSTTDSQCSILPDNGLFAVNNPSFASFRVIFWCLLWENSVACKLSISKTQQLGIMLYFDYMLIAQIYVTINNVMLEKKPVPM